MDCLGDDRVLGFLRGELPDIEREAIETHLDGCEPCFKLVGAAMRLGSGDAAEQPQSPEREIRGERGGDAEPDDESLPPASIADGRYLIRDLLGQGGAGAVYRAFDSQLGRQVAVKIVRAPKMGPDMAESMQARLLREARAMARVSHPNVVAVYDVGSMGDRVFVVMELVEGRTLASWQREQTRAWREVVGMFMAAGVGLAAAHRVGLVHRDFKPLNVLVGFDDRVRVTDFGLARPVAQADSVETTPSGDSLPEGHHEWTLTLTGGLVGTPRYMAPEQFRAGPADERTDQFSFCVALFTALYGRHPFFPEGTKKPPLPELAELVLAGELVTPAEEAGTPVGILEVLRRGLRVDPALRYSSMDLLIADLSKQVEPARSAQRSRTRIALLALAAVTLLGGAAFLFASAPRAQAPDAATRPDVSLADPAPAALALAPTGPSPPAVAAAQPAAAPLESAAASAPVPVRVRSSFKLPANSHKKPSAPAANPDRLKDPF